MGLYLRDLIDDRTNLVGRWPEQMDELADMIKHRRLPATRLHDLRVHDLPAPAGQS
jgi:hypothetical protein